MPPSLLLNEALKHDDGTAPRLKYDERTAPRKRYQSRKRKKIFMGVGFLSGTVSITNLDHYFGWRGVRALQVVFVHMKHVLAGPGRRARRRRAGGLLIWSKRCESGTPRCGVKQIG